MNLYISDLHFDSYKKMDEQLIKNWNENVDKDDAVYILGDFHWGNKKIWLKLLPELNGYKFLIKGNHDLKQYPAEIKRFFADIKDYKEIKDNKRTVIMQHYPIMCYRDSYDENVWMLHGHTHNTVEQGYTRRWTKELVDNYIESPDNCGHIMNVGCMMPWMDYRPQPLDVIIDAWHKIYKNN